MNATTRELRLQTACLMIVAALAIGVALYWLRPVLVPFVLALFFTAGLAPILDVIERRLGAPRLVAVAIAFVLGLVMMLLLWLFVALSVRSLLDNREIYINRFHQLAQRAEAILPFDVQVSGAPPPIPSPPPAPEPGDESSAATPPNPRTLEHIDLSAYVGKWVSLVSTALLDISSNAVMVLIFMFFLLLGGSTVTIPRAGMWRDIEGKIRGYIVTKTIISVLTGTVFGLTLWLLGVPLALVFGLLAFLLNYIPNIGPIIASLLPLPLILLDPSLSVAGMIVAIALPAGVQFVSGNIIEPKIMGESFELHPVAILLTLMFWGVIWGIVGMFLAVPMTAAVNILLERFERTRPIARILAGRFEAISELLGETAKEEGEGTA